MVSTKDVRQSGPVDPIDAKTPTKATKAEAEGKTQAPVSLSVKEGDEVVVRNDFEGTKGPLAEQAKPFLSEGTRNDVLLYGRGVDPVSGHVFTKNDL